MGIKYYCDHCGNDTHGHYNELDNDDTVFFNGKFVGKGAILCDTCWELRISRHAYLDIEFLGLERKEQ